MFTAECSQQQTFQINEMCEALKECYLMSNIPKRNLVSGCHQKKKLIKLHGGQLDVATNIYLKSCAYHADSAALVQNAAPSFMEVLAIRSPLKVHCSTCMSFKTCWSRRIYTKLSSHRSFVIKCTLSRCCISPWSFYRSLRRRREMDIFHEF